LKIPIVRALPLAFAALTFLGCGQSVEQRAAAMTGGEPARGKGLVRRYGCVSCHVIPGVAGEGTIGPSLEGISRKDSLAGKLPNEPKNMIRWIRDPQGVQPGSVMPDMGITEQDGRDIAAFLYTLR
jgi:cytochrome c